MVLIKLSNITHTVLKPILQKPINGLAKSRSSKIDPNKLYALRVVAEYVVYIMINKLFNNPPNVQQLIPPILPQQQNLKWLRPSSKSPPLHWPRDCHVASEIAYQSQPLMFTYS